MSKVKYIVTGCLVLLIVICYLNWKYEVIAVYPFRSEGQQELRVMTWNVHCSWGADEIRQRVIAELILKEDADLVLLNEYLQDSCSIADSIIKTRYPYTVEKNSHQKSGDIIYSKRTVFNSGRLYKMKDVKGVQFVKCTVSVSGDSVQVFGVHMDSNRYDSNSLDQVLESAPTSYNNYKNAQENRCLQAHWTKVAVLRSKHPVIVMGDMNDFNCAAPLDTFAICGLKDSWWEGGNGYGATYHDGWLRLRIDHILHSKELKLESIKVIETDLSDHNPVVAGFSISK